MKKRSVLNSPRLTELKRKKRNALKNKIILYSILTILFITSIIFLFRWKEINITNIQITGNKVVDTKAIKKIIDEDLKGTYAFVFPKTNFMMYPKKQIEKDLSEKFKRLKDIKLTTKNANILEVVVKERIPTYTWCGNNAPVTGDNNTCYFMDPDGYIFDEAPYFSGGVYFKFFGKLSGNGKSPLGATFLSDDLGKIINFRDTLVKMGIKPVSLFAGEDGEMNMYLSSRTDAPKISFKKDADLNKIAENLQTALDTQPLKDDFNKKYSQLLYIDLRFGNKVYYKFK